MAITWRAVLNSEAQLQLSRERDGWAAGSVLIQGNSSLCWILKLYSFSQTKFSDQDLSFNHTFFSSFTGVMLLNLETSCLEVMLKNGSMHLLISAVFPVLTYFTNKALNDQVPSCPKDLIYCSIPIEVNSGIWLSWGTWAETQIFLLLAKSCKEQCDKKGILFSTI